MNDALKDELEALTLKDLGSTAAIDLIGEARHLTHGNGIRRAGVQFGPTCAIGRAPELLNSR